MVSTANRNLIDVEGRAKARGGMIEGLCHYGLYHCLGREYKCGAPHSNNSLANDDDGQGALSPWRLVSLTT